MKLYVLIAAQWVRLWKICTNFWFFNTEYWNIWQGKGSWSPATCSNCLLQRILNPWITLSDTILLFVMSSKYSFVTGSLVFEKELLYPFLSSSIPFSLFASSSCISSSTKLSIVLYLAILWLHLAIFQLVFLIVKLFSYI